MVGKEALIALEQLARKQVRIYNDACDVGVFETPEVTGQIKAALQELRELEGGVASAWAPNGQSYKTRLAFEMDDGAIQGVAVQVSKCWSRQHFRYFYSIDISRACWTAKTAIGQESQVTLSGMN